MVDKVKSKYVIGNYGQIIYTGCRSIFIANSDEILLFENRNDVFVNKNKGNILTQDFPDQIYDGDIIGDTYGRNIRYELDKLHILFYNYYMRNGLTLELAYMTKQLGNYYYVTPDFIHHYSVEENLSRNALEFFFKCKTEGEIGRYIYLSRKGMVFARNEKDDLVIDNFNIISENEIEETFNNVFSYDMFNQKIQNREHTKFEDIDNFNVFGSVLYGTMQDYLVIMKNDCIELYKFSVKLHKNQLYNIKLKKYTGKINHKTFFNTETCYLSDPAISRKRKK